MENIVEVTGEFKEGLEQFLVRVRQEDLDKAELMARSGEIKVIRVGETDFYVVADKVEGSDCVSVWPVEWGWSGKEDGWVSYNHGSLLSMIVHHMNLVKELSEFKDEAVIEVIPKQN